MKKFNAQQWTEYIKQYKNPLIVAGEGCDQIPLNGKVLVEYAVDLAGKLDCPIAATGNVILSVKKQDGIKAKKMWLAELFRYLEEEWEEPFLEERPDLLLFIGYRPDQLKGMAAGAKEIGIANLGPGKLASAQLNMGEIPLAEWKQNLDELIQAL